MIQHINRRNSQLPGDARHRQSVNVGHAGRKNQAIRYPVAQRYLGLGRIARRYLQRVVFAVPLFLKSPMTDYSDAMSCRDAQVRNGTECSDSPDIAANKY
ncbi:MAG: hypothetical protein ACPGSB_07200, partial [Opitutales bacterium]